MKRALSKDALATRYKNLFNEWTRLHARRPRLLYHYTDAAGLLGMLKSQRLWATNSRFMNDPTETEYAAQLVTAITWDLQQDYPSTLFLEVSKAIQDLLKAYVDYGEQYLACFCENGDLLSQWRGYGATGGGYALGFTAKYMGLNYYPRAEKPEPILRKVLYRKRQQEALITKWVRFLFDWEILRRRRPSQKKVPMNFRDEGWLKFNWFISECLRCFKDPAYAEEKEWRVIQHGISFYGQNAVIPDFRASRGKIVQFVELDFTNSKSKYKGKLPLKTIRYGPTLDTKVTARSLDLLCREKGYGNLVTISKSGVPFSG